MSIPCDSQILNPFDGCDDGGGDSGGGSNCGRGLVRLQTSNQSFNFRFNATFNYDATNSNNITANNFNSHTSGITFGTDYNHGNSSYWVAGDGTINFTVTGTLDYNLFVDGVGTIGTQNVTLRGSFNPCNGGGGNLELFLQPAVGE